jgi:hypothetical protein
VEIKETVKTKRMDSINKRPDLSLRDRNMSPQITVPTRAFNKVEFILSPIYYNTYGNN